MNLFASTALPVRQDLQTKATDACVVLAFAENTVNVRVDNEMTTTTTTTVSFICMTITIQHCKSVESIVITII